MFFIIDEPVSFFLPILLIIAIVFCCYRFAFFRLAELPTWASPLLFLTKLLFGFALWAVYTFYYTDRANSDIYKFYDDAHYVHQSFFEDRSVFTGLMTGSEDSSYYTSQMKNWERNFNKSVPFNENRFMIRLNALMMFVSGENIHIHTIFFCFFSFIGCILLLRLFQHYAPDGKKKWMVLTMLLPSFLFWTSGGLKESIIILGIGMLLYGFVFLRERAGSAVIIFFGGVILLLMTKYFLLICLLPALISYHLLYHKSSLQNIAVKYAGVLLLSVMALVVIAPMSKKVDFARIIAKKQKHAIAEAMYMKAGSYSEVPVVEDNLFSVVKAMPRGLCNTMTKPYIWQSRNPMMLLSAGENILILLLLIFAFVYRGKTQKLNYNLMFFTLVSLIIYFSIIGIMTPVLGNLVRYKVILMPLLVFDLLYVMKVPPYSPRFKSQGQ